MGWGRGGRLRERDENEGGRQRQRDKDLGLERERAVKRKKGWLGRKRDIELNK